MTQNVAADIRSVAESIINNSQRMSQRPNPHTINFYTEEFIGGYAQDGRMSVVRRFFCLFVTFDLVFVSLLWLICIMITGDNIFQAFQKQIINYTIYTSLFDVVAVAILRFIVLIFFYALLYINHWIIIALSTSGSCLFLISKVFVFNWVQSNPQIIEVILILTSFMLAWGEAWFLDCRVIPQEQHARQYVRALTSSDRSPLIAPFLASQSERPPESASNFYSPFDSAPPSDEEEEVDEEYHQMGLDCLRKAYDVFQLPEDSWKVERVTKKGDTIRSIHRDKIGKIYRLTGSLRYPGKALLDELFYRVEEMPTWNPTLLEFKVVRKVNSYTDITYQVTASAGGGMVKSRDFVNLRCWRLFCDGKICDEEGEVYDDEMIDTDSSVLTHDESVTTVSEFLKSRSMYGTESQFQNLNFSSSSTSLVETSMGSTTLSQSLGAQTFSTYQMPPMDSEEPPPLDEEFEDAKDHLDEHKKVMDLEKPEASRASLKRVKKPKEKVWISGGISIDYAKMPPTGSYTRGENIVAAFAIHEVEDNPESCIFDWILCLDLKGYIPRYVLDTTYTSFMSDYMMYLRKHLIEMRQQRRTLIRASRLQKDSIQ